MISEAELLAWDIVRVCLISLACVKLVVVLLHVLRLRGEVAQVRVGLTGKRAKERLS